MMSNIIILYNIIYNHILYKIIMLGDHLGCLGLNPIHCIHDKCLVLVLNDGTIENSNPLGTPHSPVLVSFIPSVVWFCWFVLDSYLVDIRSYYYLSAPGLLSVVFREPCSANKGTQTSHTSSKLLSLWAFSIALGLIFETPHVLLEFLSYFLSWFAAEQPWDGRGPCSHQCESLCRRLDGLGCFKSKAGTLGCISGIQRYTPFS